MNHRTDSQGPFPRVCADCFKTRGQWDAQIFTNDRRKLPQALGHDVSHQGAHKPEQAIAPMQHQEAARSQQPEKDLGMGMGIGLGF
jgi:hypothetical protein